MKYSKLKNKEFKYVLRVEWLDASNDDNSWKHTSEMPDIEPMKCINWGCLTKYDNDYIVIHSGQSENDHIVSRFVILKDNIINIKKIDDI